MSPAGYVRAGTSVYKVAAVLLLISLGGCAEYRARVDARQAAARAAEEQADDATCRGYGVAPGSQPYVACRMNLANTRAQQLALEAELHQRRSEALMATGVAIMQSGQR